MNRKMRSVLGLCFIHSSSMLPVEAQAQNDTGTTDNAPQCLNKEPEEITRQMLLTYPDKWKKYINSAYGYRLSAPRFLLIENDGKAGSVTFSPNWCGGEPGSSSPFQWTISFFSKLQYKPKPITDFVPLPKIVYLKPIQSEISCGKLRFHQDAYKNSDVEYSYAITDRIVIERGENVYEISFRYGVDGQALKAGHKAATEEKRFIAENEQLKCDVLSSFKFRAF